MHIFVYMSSIFVLRSQAIDVSDLHNCKPSFDMPQVLPHADRCLRDLAKGMHAVIFGLCDASKSLML